MPRLSSFYGITIARFWREQNHPVAHFHAEYGEHAASFAVDGRLLAGSLPPRALRLVREWASLHQDELLANWEQSATWSRWWRSSRCRSIVAMTDVPPLLRVTHVEVLGDHELRLTFDDGLVGDVAFEDHEWRGVLAPLRDPARFEDVGIEMGTLCWPGGLDIAPEPLYEEARRRRLARPRR